MSLDARIEIPPCWKIVPPGQADEIQGIRLVLGPGSGYGDGTHQTTQLCLQAISALAPKGRAWRMLDFGSGSGILAIAAAKLGAVVEAIEIDREAIHHAVENARLNELADRIRYSATLDGVSGQFDMVAANILRQVLLEHADDLASRLSPQGRLVLSGLVPTDVPQVSVRYAGLLDGRRPEIYRRDDWCALVWRPDKERIR